MANGVGSAAGRSKRDQMPKQIRLTSFDMNCVGHQESGMRPHPRDRADRYNTLDYWVELAKAPRAREIRRAVPGRCARRLRRVPRIARRGDCERGAVPVNDPLLLIPAMAYVTRNLGFGVTCAGSYEHPYTLARRFSTLDHLTGGRAGRDVVTRYLNSAAKGIGHT